MRPGRWDADDATIRPQGPARQEGVWGLGRWLGRWRRGRGNGVGGRRQKEVRGVERRWEGRRDMRGGRGGKSKGRRVQGGSSQRPETSQ